MGYSKIEINFTDVPHDDILYITESKLGLNLNVLLETIAVLHASSYSIYGV
jgi:hypothetical protein